MSNASVSNIYQVLGVNVHDDARIIAQAIAKHRQQQTLRPEILDKAEQWLLNDAIRARYDEKLKQQAPHLFEATMPELQLIAQEPSDQPLQLAQEESQTPDLTLQTDNAPTRLGLMDETIHDGRGDVRIEPDVYFEQDTYTTSYKQYNLMSKLIIYGAIGSFVLGLILLFAWPFLKSTVFAPSEWDKVEIRQEWEARGWQEDAPNEYVYLQDEEYSTRLGLVYEKDLLWPLLMNTGCDMTPQGLCDVDVTIRKQDGGVFEFQDTVGLGLRDHLPLVTRGKREDMLDALEEAKSIDVRIYNGNQAIDMRFKP